MANIRITDKQTVTPTGSDFMLINQAGSDKNTTLARLKTYTNGSAALETVAQDQNSAINEVNKIATNNSTAINGINTKIGSGTLETTSQNYVGAINEINKKVGNEKLETVAENTTGAVNELNKKIGNIDVENDGTVATQLNAIVKYPKMQYTSNITTTILKSVSGGSANWTSPQWNVKKYDTNYFIENDNTSITIKQSGLYMINLAINLNVSNGTNFSIKLIKNYGDTGAEEIAYENKVASNVSTRINLYTTCYINQNETLKALIYHEGQSDVNLVCGYGFPMISVTKVGEIG